MKLLQILQKCLEDWKNISHLDFCLVNLDNTIYISTCDRALPSEEKLEEFKEDEALCISNMNCRLYKVTESHQLQYILIVWGNSEAASTIGELAVCQIESLLTAYMEKSDKNVFMPPRVMVVDSIQTMYLPEIASAPGSVSQVRESASQIIRMAKATGCSVFLVGHVTKEGSLAGPRVLEHMVDAVLYFEGDRQNHYRLLRAVKNRFGSVNELGMFEMTGEGMREVTNASEALLSERAHDASGSVVMCALEGTRPLLTDVQALVARAPFGTPRRMASGVDQGRLSLLLAVLEKRAGLRLFDQDVYINIAGGMALTEPAADLALCAAVTSSLRAKPIGGTFAVMGEVGLAGEVRAVPQAERRLNECLRLGFRNVVLPKGNLRGMRVPEGMHVYPADTVLDAIAALELFDRG